MTRFLSIVFLLVALTVNAAAQTRGTAGNGCDRECLRRMINQYLDSLVAHDPKILPTAPNLKFTEGTKTTQLGEGLWKTASKIRSYRQDFLDVREGQAASHVLVEENGTPVCWHCGSR